MPYPFSVVIGRVSISDGYSNYDYAVQIWTLISQDLYEALMRFNEIQHIQEKLDNECQIFFWSKRSSVSDTLIDDDSYRIEVGEKEIVVDLI